jgi:hypothetical protein
MDYLEKLEFNNLMEKDDIALLIIQKNDMKLYSISEYLPRDLKFILKDLKRIKKSYNTDFNQTTGFFPKYIHYKIGKSILKEYSSENPLIRKRIFDLQ